MKRALFGESFGGSSNSGGGSFTSSVKKFRRELLASLAASDEVQMSESFLKERKIEEQVGKAHPLCCCPLSGRLMNDPVSATDGES